MLCDDVTDSLNEEMIAVDGSCVRQALRIALVRADTFYYSTSFMVKAISLFFKLNLSTVVYFYSLKFE